MIDYKKWTDSLPKSRNDLEQKHSVSIIPVYFDLGDKEQIKTGVKINIIGISAKNINIKRYFNFNK